MGPVVAVWTWYRVGSRNERPGSSAGDGSRLMQALREREGMTYSVWSYFHPFRFERPFVIQFQADPQSMDRAIAEVTTVTKQFATVG